MKRSTSLMSVFLFIFFFSPLAEAVLLPSSEDMDAVFATLALPSHPVVDYNRRIFPKLRDFKKDILAADFCREFFFLIYKEIIKLARQKNDLNLGQLEEFIKTSSYKASQEVPLFFQTMVDRFLPQQIEDAQIIMSLWNKIQFTFKSFKIDTEMNQLEIGYEWEIISEQPLAFQLGSGWTTIRRPVEPPQPDLIFEEVTL